MNEGGGIGGIGFVGLMGLVALTGLVGLIGVLRAIRRLTSLGQTAVDQICDAFAEEMPARGTPHGGGRRHRPDAVPMPGVVQRDRRSFRKLFVVVGTVLKWMVRCGMLAKGL